jgi:hypothetical protein
VGHAATVFSAIPEKASLAHPCGDAYSERMNITFFQVRCVNVPMPEPHRTASGVVAVSPLVLLTVPLEVSDGVAYASERVGSGVEFNEDAVQRYVA